MGIVEGQETDNSPARRILLAIARPKGLEPSTTGSTVRYLDRHGQCNSGASIIWLVVCCPVFAPVGANAPNTSRVCCTGAAETHAGLETVRFVPGLRLDTEAGRNHVIFGRGTCGRWRPRVEGWPQSWVVQAVGFCVGVVASSGMSRQHLPESEKSRVCTICEAGCFSPQKELGYLQCKNPIGKRLPLTHHGFLGGRDGRASDKRGFGSTLSYGQSSPMPLDAPGESNHSIDPPLPSTSKLLTKQLPLRKPMRRARPPPAIRWTALPSPTPPATPPSTLDAAATNAAAAANAAADAAGYAADIATANAANAAVNAAAYAAAANAGCLRSRHLCLCQRRVR